METLQGERHARARAGASGQVGQATHDLVIMQRAQTQGLTVGDGMLCCYGIFHTKTHPVLAQ